MGSQPNIFLHNMTRFGIQSVSTIMSRSSRIKRCTKHVWCWEAYRCLGVHRPLADCIRRIYVLCRARVRPVRSQRARVAITYRSRIKIYIYRIRNGKVLSMFFWIHPLLTLRLDHGLRYNGMETSSLSRPRMYVQGGKCGRSQCVPRVYSALCKKTCTKIQIEKTNKTTGSAKNFKNSILISQVTPFRGRPSTPVDQVVSSPLYLSPWARLLAVTWEGAGSTYHKFVSYPVYLNSWYRRTVTKLFKWIFLTTRVFSDSE